MGRYLHARHKAYASDACGVSGKAWQDMALLFAIHKILASCSADQPCSAAKHRHIPQLSPKSSPRRKCLRPKCRTQACNASVLALSASPNTVSRKVLGASSTRAARGADDIMCVAAWVPVPRTQPASSLASEHGKIASPNAMRCVVERVTQRRRADSGNAED
jgi:hypothetical protein